MRKFLSALLCAAVLLLSPGPLATRAFANTIRPASAGAPLNPRGLGFPAQPSGPIPNAQTAALAAPGALPASLPDSIAVSLDSSRAFEERRGAVQILEGRGDKSALEHVANIASQGNAQDYEIHRFALQALARLGTVLPLRPMSRALADEILDRIAQGKPAAFFDYDGTLADHMEPISPEIAAGFESAADAEAEVSIVTVRRFEPHPETPATIMQSLAPMTAKQKAGINLISNTGNRHYLFDRKGDPILLREAFAAVAQRFGSEAYPAGGDRSDKQPPFLSISKANKALPVARLRANIRPYEQTRRWLRWGLPGRLAAALWKLYHYLPALPIEAEKILIVGDDFIEGGSDVYMAQAAPGSLVLAVNGGADPRLENAFVWPTKEKAASLEILSALGRPTEKSADRKALLGLFGQRTAGIAGFILVAIAYVFIAVPVVGWPGYGALMAFSQLAAIATAPLNGLLVDKLSPRTAMMANTIIRIGLLLAVPTFYFFHVMSFSTLLLAAAAEGWLLSSILTVEDAVIKHVFARKPESIHSINNLLWLNFLVLQVVLGEILQVGQIVDKCSPFLVYLFAGLLNLFIAVPFILLLPKAPASGEIPNARADAIQGVSFKAFWRGEYDEPSTDGRKRLRAAALYIALGASMLYPLQYYALPHIAQAVVGESAKGNMHGQLLGALFFGNLISTASQKELPLVRLPVIGRIKGKRLAQALVLALAALWTAWRLAPGNFWAAALAVAAAIGPMALAERLTDRGWLALFGVGFAAIWLPFLVWTFPGLFPFLSLPTALFLSLIAVGMCYAPTYPFLKGYFQKNARREAIGKASGIQSALFNFSIALSYALFSLVADALHPTFPALLGVIGLVFLVAGVFFYFSPRFLPDLPKTLFHPRSNKP